MSSQYVGRRSHAFFGSESLTTAGVQDRTSAMNDAGDTPQMHLPIIPVKRIVEILLEHPLVAATDADDFVTKRQRGPNNRADARVHTGSVAAARENSDTQSATFPQLRLESKSRACDNLIHAVHAKSAWVKTFSGQDAPR
jgi:hypothetical protein